MVKDNTESLEYRRQMSVSEELEYLARNSIRTYNNSWRNPGFLEHAQRECLINESVNTQDTLKLKTA